MGVIKQYRSISTGILELEDKCNQNQKRLMTVVDEYNQYRSIHDIFSGISEKYTNIVHEKKNLRQEHLHLALEIKASKESDELHKKEEDEYKRVIKHTKINGKLRSTKMEGDNSVIRRNKSCSKSNQNTIRKNIMESCKKSVEERYQPDIIKGDEVVVKDVVENKTNIEGEEKKRMILKIKKYLKKDGRENKDMKSVEERQQSDIGNSDEADAKDIVKNKTNIEDEKKKWMNLKIKKYLNKNRRENKDEFVTELRKYGKERKLKRPNKEKYKEKSGKETMKENSKKQQVRNKTGVDNKPNERRNLTSILQMLEQMSKKDNI